MTKHLLWGLKKLKLLDLKEKDDPYDPGNTESGLGGGGDLDLYSSTDSGRNAWTVHIVVAKLYSRTPGQIII